MGSIANISEVNGTSSFILALKMEISCTSEMSATLPTSAWHNQARTKLTYFVHIKHNSRGLQEQQHLAAEPCRPL
jgi:hypothetical protein